jgi:hypothetical protein
MSKMAPVMERAVREAAYMSPKKKAGKSAKGGKKGSFKGSMLGC